MANQTGSVKRTAPAKKSGTGLKALIMTVSLAMMIGGGGTLAAGQSQNAIDPALQSQTFAQPSSPAPQTRLRANNSIQFQAAAPATQPRPIARTRSSR